MLKVKNGVSPKNLVIAAAAANVAHVMDVTVYITSGTDGKHMTGSKHYTGEALDLRISNLTKPQIHEVVSRLKTRLGLDYDVILESDHIHIEHDPNRN